MDEHLTAEIIHLKCPHCAQTTSLSYGTLAHGPEPPCGFCGRPIEFDLEAVKQEARRKAHELDQSADSLGSVVD